MTKYFFSLIVFITVTESIFGQMSKDIAEGDMAFINGEYENAITFYDTALSLNNSDDYTYYLRGLAKFYLSDYAEAVSDFTKAIALSPDDKNQAWSYKQRTVKFGNTYRISSFGMSIEHKYFHAFFYRGQAKLQLEDFRGAIADLDIVITFDNKSYMGYTIRGSAKYNLRDYNGAKNDFSRSIELNPDYAQAYFERAYCYLHLNEIDESCLDFSRAGELGIVEAYDAIREYCN